MKNFNEFINRICDENFEQGIEQVVEKMIKVKMKDNDIIKLTNITQEELNKLKLQV